MSESKRPVGRPCELNEQVIERALEYASGGFEEQGNAVPSAVGLAVYLGKSRNVIYEWAKRNQEFNDIVEAISTAQEMMLIDGGLRNQFNANFAKLMMAKLGYSDKQDVDVTTGGAKVSAPVFQIVSVASGVSEDDSTSENT